MGTPPQGRADFTFFQHILRSMDPTTGRCAVLFPHGVLFRREEAELRRRLIEADLVEAVIGLGPGLFYNSPMEACIVVCRAKKPAKRRGKLLFIDAVNEVARERAMSSLRPEHQERIEAAYAAFADEDGFAKVASLDDIAAQGHSLSIPLYVRRPAPSFQMGEGGLVGPTIQEAWDAWEREGRAFWMTMDEVLQLLDGLAGEPMKWGANG